MQLEEQIAERVAGFSYDSIDADTFHVLKRNVLDSYAGIFRRQQFKRIQDTPSE